MSSTVLESTYSDPFRGVIMFPQRFAAGAKRRVVATAPARRGSRAQGKALETLGHAIEYLADSRVLQPGGSSAKAHGQAISILARSSREIYAEFPEVTPVSQRLRGWLRSLAGGERIDSPIPSRRGQGNPSPRD